jgi:hypothetical protein
MQSRLEIPRFGTSRLWFPSLGSVNLALLSLYFFPLWGRDAGRVLFSSSGSLADHGHTTAAIYFSGLFGLSFKGMLLTSYALAGIKLVIAAAFVSYLIEFARAWATRREADPGTIDVVLILAVAEIMLSLIPAVAFGDAALVRLYSTQMLLVAGAIIVVVVERHLGLDARPEVAANADTPALPVGALAAGPPPAPAAAALARIPEGRLRTR